MTQLTLELRPNVTVLAVLVPKNEHGDYVEGYEIRGAHPDRELEVLSFYGEANAKWLPPGKWEIIGLLREVSEEMAAGLCDEYIELGAFPCYKAPGKDLWLPTGKQCITEAITASGGDPEANYLLLKQIK